jgi:hypothetical protein
MFPKPRLMSLDPYKRALERILTHWCNVYFAPSMFSMLFEKPSYENLYKEEIEFEFYEQLSYLEKWLGQGKEVVFWFNKHLLSVLAFRRNT